MRKIYNEVHKNKGVGGASLQFSINESMKVFH